MAYKARSDLLSHKLTKQEVADLLRQRKQGVTLKQLAEQFDIHENTVRNVVNRAKATGEWSRA